MNEQPHPGGDAWDVGPEPTRDEPNSFASDDLAFGAGLGGGSQRAKPARTSKAPARRKRRTKSKAPADADAEAPPKERARSRSKATRDAKGDESSRDSETEAPEETPRRSRKSRAGTTSRSRTEETQPEEDGEPKRKRSRRTRRKSPSAEGDSSSGRSEDPGSRSDDGEDRDEAPRTRRAKPARKRTSSRKRAAGSDDEAGDSPRAADKSRTDRDGEDDADGEDGTRRRRRRGTRGGRRKKKAREGAAIELIPGEDDDLPTSRDEDSDSREGEHDEPKRSKKRSRGRRKKKGSDGERDEADEEESSGSGRKKKAKKRRGRSQDTDSDKDSEERGEGRSSRKKKRSRSKKVTGDEPPEPKPETKRDQVILVNAVDVEEKRVAVVGGGKIVDFLMNSESSKTLVNDIYRGKIVNLEPAIGAAFVDFGQGRNGFLHTSDVLGVYGEDGFSLDKLLTAEVDPDEWDEDAEDELDEEDSSDTDSEDGADDEDSGGKGRGRRKAKSKSKGGKGKDNKRGRGGERRRARQRLPITDLVNLGDQVVVQITKDAIGDKGPTLTTYISIPGRYLVLMPSMARTGVSRKIPDDKERRRLKRILSSLDVPSNMGVIVRTAGVGKTKTDLRRDLEYLLGVWETFGKRLKHGRGPVPLYQESELSIRTLRDLFGPRTEAVIVDDPIVHEQLLEFAERLMPEHVDRIKLHEGDRPLFHSHGIEQDFERIFTRRVDLPSGGSIVFDQTEALVAIDVNSGRTRSDGFDFEEIALKTNLEAVPEIARQIRLRDLGGIIVCDFIDMMRTASMRSVERALRAELADDRARSKLGRISQFGLLEMTRQRLGPGTHKKVFQACPRCRGTARIRTVPSRAAAILRRLGSAVTQKGFSQVEVRAHPEVVDYLKDSLRDYTRALEHRSEKSLKFTSVADQPEDSVLRYLRTDGREVRPGGRRKR